MQSRQALLQLLFLLHAVIPPGNYCLPVAQAQTGQGSLKCKPGATVKHVAIPLILDLQLLPFVCVPKTQCQGLLVLLAMHLQQPCLWGILYKALLTL